MKKIGFIVASVILLASCNNKQLDTNTLKGKWTLEDINHPMFEDDYKNRKASIDTITVVDLGMRAYWNTDNVDSVKQLLNKMIDDEYNLMKASFMDLSFDFVDDSTVLRISRNTADSNRYVIVDGNIILSPNKGQVDKKDTLFVEKASAEKLELKEKFLKSFVTLKLKK